MALAECLFSWHRCCIRWFTERNMGTCTQLCTFLLLFHHWINHWFLTLARRSCCLGDHSKGTWVAQQVLLFGKWRLEEIGRVRWVWDLCWTFCLLMEALPVSLHRYIRSLHQLDIPLPSSIANGVPDHILLLRMLLPQAAADIWPRRDLIVPLSKVD